MFIFFLEKITFIANADDGSEIHQHMVCFFVRNISFSYPLSLTQPLSELTHSLSGRFA